MASDQGGRPTPASRVLLHGHVPCGPFGSLRFAFTCCLCSEQGSEVRADFARGGLITLGPETPPWCLEFGVTSRRWCAAQSCSGSLVVSAAASLLRCNSHSSHCMNIGRYKSIRKKTKSPIIPPLGGALLVRSGLCAAHTAHGCLVSLGAGSNAASR